MRSSIVGFLRQAANAIHASTILERGAERARSAKRAAKGRVPAKSAAKGRAPAKGRGRTPASSGPPAPTAAGSLVIGGVTVEYTPSMDGEPDPGEIVWAWVAYEDDPSQGKDRPVVVIGRRRSGLVGVPLTSKQDDRDPQVPVGTGPWDREGRPSYARVDRLVPLDASGVRREGAVLPRDRFDDVIAGLRRLHGN